MKDYNEEYFFIRETDLNIYPLFKYAHNEPKSEMELIREIQMKESQRARHLCYAKPIPRNPKLGDYHRIKENCGAISERLKQVLESFSLKDVQLVPAIISNLQGTEHEGYTIIHVCNLIKCMDKEKSSWSENELSPGKAFRIDKLVLDNNLIEEIPLEERLVFAAWENSLKVLYHRTVIDKILEIAPKGLTIYHLSKWDSGAPFREAYSSYLNEEDDDE